MAKRDKVITRKIMNLIDVMPKIGGFVKFITVVFAFITLSGQTFIFEKEVISKIFMVNPDDYKEKKIKYEKKLVEDLDRLGKASLQSKVSSM